MGTQVMLSIENIYQDCIRAYNQTKTKAFRTPNFRTVDANEELPSEGFFLRTQFIYETAELATHFIFEYEYTQMVMMVRKMLVHAKQFGHAHIQHAGTKTNKWSATPISPKHFNMHLTAILNGVSETWEIPIEWVACQDTDEGRTTVIRYLLVIIRRFIEEQTGRTL